MSTNPEKLKKSSLFHVLIITTLAIGLYLNTLKNGFVYDDEFTIVETFARASVGMEMRRVVFGFAAIHPDNDSVKHAYSRHISNSSKPLIRDYQYNI